MIQGMIYSWVDGKKIAPEAESNCCAAKHPRVWSPDRTPARVTKATSYPSSTLINNNPYTKRRKISIYLKPRAKFSVPSSDKMYKCVYSRSREILKSFKFCMLAEALVEHAEELK